jgi:hypothetical protein
MNCTTLAGWVWPNPTLVIEFGGQNCVAIPLLLLNICVLTYLYFSRRRNATVQESVAQPHAKKKKNTMKMYRKRVLFHRTHIYSAMKILARIGAQVSVMVKDNKPRDDINMYIVEKLGEKCIMMLSAVAEITPPPPRLQHQTGDFPVTKLTCHPNAFIPGNITKTDTEVMRVQKISPSNLVELIKNEQIVCTVHIANVHPAGCQDPRTFLGNAPKRTNIVLGAFVSDHVKQLYSPYVEIE